MNTTQQPIEALRDALQEFGTAETLEQLAAYSHDRYYMIDSIQHGLGNLQRDANEDPAAVLQELRDAFRLDVRKEADRAYFRLVLTNLITAADQVVTVYYRPQRNA